MKFLFVYRGGDVPDAEADRNIRELWTWLDNLKARGHETARFAGFGRSVVSRDAVDGYEGDVFGISIVEAENLKQAVALTSDWPELPYGGRIEIFEALPEA